MLTQLRQPERWVYKYVISQAMPDGPCKRGVRDGYSVYLLYWYKSTNTDAEGAGSMLYSICGVGWGIAGKMAEDSESMRALYG